MYPLKLADSYIGKKEYPFPSEDISQTQKRDTGYFRAAVNAILSKFINNKCAIPYTVDGSGLRSIEELRAYRMGCNSVDKYKDLYIGKEANGRRGKTTVNISWDLLQILPQKIDVVKGYLQKIDYEPDVQAIDYESLIDKKTLVSMAKLVSDARIEQMKAAVNESAGQPLLQDADPSELPGGQKFENPSQVDIAAQMGMFFLEEEAALQNLLDKTQSESGSDGIADLVRDDFVTIARSGKWVYTNPVTNIVMEDWIDMATAIVPYSDYLDYRDASYGARIKKWTIARLLQETDITETQAIEIARSYSKSGGVGESVGFFSNIVNDRNTMSSFGMHMWHQIEVDVVDAVWFGSRNVNMTSVKKKAGNLTVNIVEDEYVLEDGSKNRGKNLDKFKGQTVYKAKMVIGTDFIFDYGEDNDITFKKDIRGNLTPMLPCRFVWTGSSSLVERCIGFVDDAHLANYKLRVARMKMPAPPNLQIDKSALEGIRIDGVSFKPRELLKILSDEGFLITDSKNAWGNNVNNGSRAVQPIGTDMMNVITAWWEDMGRSIAMIEKVTGINDVFAAQTPSRQTGLGVSNLLIQGAQNALTPIIKADEYLTEQPWRIATRKWQIVASYLPEEEKKKLSISRSLEIISIGSKMPERDFDLTIQARPNQEQIDQLLVDLQNMRAAQRQGGQQGLNEADYLVVEEMLRSKKVKQAQLYMAAAIDKRQRQAQEEQQQAIQMNGQQQQASAQQKGQIDAQNIQVQGQVDQQLDAQKQEAQGRQAIQAEIIRGQNNLAAIRLKAMLEGKQSA